MSNEKIKLYIDEELQRYFSDDSRTSFDQGYLHGLISAFHYADHLTHAEFCALTEILYGAKK